MFTSDNVDSSHQLGDSDSQGRGFKGGEGRVLVHGLVHTGSRVVTLFLGTCIEDRVRLCAVLQLGFLGCCSGNRRGSI
jgi:hypothetical protein